MPRKEWMTAGLATSCEQKSILYKQYITTGANESRVKFIMYRNKLKTLLNKAENDYYSLKFKNCSNDSKRTWQIINSMLNKNIQHIAPPSEFNLDNSLITDANEIAENFNEYFVNIGKKLAQNIGDPKNSFLSYMPQNLTNENSCAFHLTTSFEIIDIVKAMKTGESAGIDEISMNLIKSVI